MTRYNDEQWDMEGDFDDMLRDMAVISYRNGVDRVLEYIVRARPRAASLIAELRDAISRGDI